ncbi:prephenate dehydrogenase/arogenate dehydrogenase family protein [Ferrimicrobium sp.]|uniref:prephenate dehydrogenase n=1 Tax=Ferrimicrobium sp. TaxID=2926050 RepID=UPI002637B756|nr:prephenate dehydrogenase/arogenate dehydrogenase family protein [Ferrimicrobium sp.]
MEGVHGRLASVGVVGLGHLGASLAAALTNDVTVVGFDSNPVSMSIVVQRFGINTAASLLDLVCQSELIVLAVPTPAVRGVRDQLETLADLTGSRPVVCDIASVKNELALDDDTPSSLSYISLHPMAGREGNGAESADPSIFANANWAVVLTGQEEPQALASALLVPLTLGNGVIPILLADHDRAIAMVSTLPHVSAVALGRLVGQAADRVLLRRLAAGSIRDSVRVARTDPARIVEMLYPNRAQLIGAIDALIGELQACLVHLEDERWLLAWTRDGHDGACSLDDRDGRRSSSHVPQALLVDELIRLAGDGAMIVGLGWEGDDFRLDLVGG